MRDGGFNQRARRRGGKKYVGRGVRMRRGGEGTPRKRGERRGERGKKGGDEP
jgi:hypothetical protein